MTILSNLIRRGGSCAVCMTSPLLLSATAVWASTLEETVIVASRVQTPLATLGVSVSTIDRESMDLLGYTSVDNLLDLQPGVTVSNAGGYGKASTVRIRGEEGFRTRIQLDGIDIADPSSPQISPRIEHLLTDGIQRIEVLRGPQGLLYGADGGGVVAISTRPATRGLTGQILLEGGSDNFERYSALVSGGSDAVRASASATTVATEGFNSRALDDVSADRDGYSNTTLHATLEADLTEQWQIGASAHRVEGDNDYDGCFDNTTFATIHDCTDDYQQMAWRTFARWSGRLMDITASYENNQIERAFFSAGVESFATDGENEEISLLANVHLDNDRRLTLGADQLTQRLIDGSNTRTRDNLGVYAEYQHPVLAGNVQLGARLDDNDDFGQHTSWRVSLYQPLSQSLPIAVTAAGGTGFRAPSLYEIAYNNGPFAFSPASNSPLNEETSRGWEAGLRWDNQSTRVSVVWFAQTLEDEIYFDLIRYAGYLQRAGSHDSKGLEVEGSLTLRQWSLSGNITWNDTEDAQGEQRPYRPELTAAVTLNWQGERFSSALSTRLARDSVDTAGAAMPDYVLVDLAGTAILSDQLTLTARIENLTDDDFEQVQGYYTAGRRYFLGLRFNY